MLLAYTKKSVIILSIIISIIVYVFVQIIIFQIKENYQNKINSKINFKIDSQDFIVSNILNGKNSISPQNTNKNNQDIWKIYIPKINLTANIREGTSQNIISNSVGHFEETSTWNGNVALAAHNRGNSNYFKNIDKLQIGDEIIYETHNGIRKYKVEINQRIEETDWSYLKDTKDNKITLITCVKNMPEYRTCIQATQI